MDGVCAMCREYSPFCELHDDLGVFLCPDCYDRVDGKFVVDRCKCCGHVKGIYFIPYKKRGRPKGSKNKPKNMAVLEV